MQKGFSYLHLVIGGIVLFMVGIVGYFGYHKYQEQQLLKSINSFDSCAQQYPVLDSYPGQCNTPDGRHFVQPLTPEEQQRLKPPVQILPDITPEPTGSGMPNK